MKNIIGRLALLSLLVVSVSPQASADVGYSEGTWAVAARGGIAPSKFSRDVHFTATATFGVADPADDHADINTATVEQKTNSAKYSKVYSLPFTAGADIGYFVCDNLELFLNFDYTHACSKKVAFVAEVINVPTNQIWKVRDLNSYAGYLGARNYFCPMGCILPFVGAKLGFRSTGSCNGSETYTVLPSATVRNQLNFTRTSGGDTGFSGGLQLGLDWMIADCYALTFMSEMIGTTGKNFKSGKQIHRQVAGGKIYTNITRNPNGVLSFPLTLGLRIRM